MCNLTTDECHVLLDVISHARSVGVLSLARWASDGYTTEPETDPKASVPGWMALLESAAVKLEHAIEFDNDETKED